MRKTTQHWIIIALLVFWKILRSKCRLLVPGGHCESFVSSGDWPSLKTVTRISSNNIASSSFYQLLNKSHVIHLERRRPMSSFLVPPMHLLPLAWQPSDDKTEKWKVSMPLTLMLNGETCVCWIAENRWSVAVVAFCCLFLTTRPPHRHINYNNRQHWLSRCPGFLVSSQWCAENHRQPHSLTLISPSAWRTHGLWSSYICRCCFDSATLSVQFSGSVEQRTTDRLR